MENPLRFLFAFLEHSTFEEYISNWIRNFNLYVVGKFLFLVPFEPIKYLSILNKNNMKQTFFKSLLIMLFVSMSAICFAQSSNKDQLIKDVNTLFQSCKKWDYEGIVLDKSGSFKYHICLSPDCNPYVSWDYYIKNLKSIELGKMDEYTVINFTCGENDCIVPTGYEKGGKYDIKNQLQFIISDEKKAKELVAKLNQLKAMEWSN